jgi:hypothetical protein
MSVVIFSSTSVSSTNKTDHYDIIEILLNTTTSNIYRVISSYKSYENSWARIVQRNYNITKRTSGYLLHRHYDIANQIVITF